MNAKDALIYQNEYLCQQYESNWEKRAAAFMCELDG